jgi:hypothetical protein
VLSWSRLFGLAGIVGGVVLLAAFVVEISPGANTIRLVLFNLCSMTVIVGVHRRQAPIAPGFSLLAAVPAFVANAWYLAMTLLAIGIDRPFAGDFGLVYFFAGAAMWVADAVLGVVMVRLGPVGRWGPLALAVGSALAFTGMDRLELTTRDNPTVFLQLSLIGIALNGLSWILLGIDLVASARRNPREAVETATV